MKQTMLPCTVVILLLCSYGDAQPVKVSPQFDKKSGQVVLSSEKQPDQKCWKAVSNDSKTYALQRISKCIDGTDLKSVKVEKLPDGAYSIDGKVLEVIILVDGKKGIEPLGPVVDQGPFIIVVTSTSELRRTDQVTDVKQAEPPSGPGSPSKKQKVQLTLDKNVVVAEFTTAPAATCWKPRTGIQYELLKASDECLIDVEVRSERVERDQEGTYWVAGKRIRLKLMMAPDLVADLSKAPPDKGPVLIVSETGSIVRTMRVLERRSQFDSCIWTGEADVRIDLLRRSVDKVPSRSIVHPNEGIIVQVCYDPQDDITVQWGGTRGLTRSSVGDKSSHSGVDAGDKPVQISSLPFPPRQTGSADIKVFIGTDTNVAPIFIVELEVEPTYWGAIRFGLGTIFGDWKTYEVATLSGSRQPEVRGSVNRAKFELVSGFALYPEAIWGGGRSQTAPFGWKNTDVAPFIGFGIVGQSSTNGVQGLTSFHAGIEIEFASNFSVALTYAYRRARVLADGYAEGSPVAMSLTADNVTTDGWSSGFAVVLNASPEFLQFASGKSADTPKGTDK